MDWLERINQFSQVAGVISVLFAAAAIRSNTSLAYRQWNVDTFTLYSQRHQKAIAAFPQNAFYSRFDTEQLPPRSPALTKAVLNYLFVICDVHYLSYQKYLDRSIWKVWERDLNRTLACPLIVREWPELKIHFEPFEAFTAFVEQIQDSET